METPQFPDWTANYVKTVVEPQREQQRLEQERLEALRAVEAERLAQVAAAPGPIVLAAPVRVTVGGDCESWIRAAGITDVANAYTLVMRESGCNPNAVNPSSGSCGLGQQLPCGKWPHQWNDPVGGLIDMQAYVYERYGSWANALSFWYSNHWY